MAGGQGAGLHRRLLHGDRLPPHRPPAGGAARFETPAGRQAQVDFAHFRVRFEDEPGAERIVWLFSLVLGHSRMMWARFVAQQDLATVLRSTSPPSRRSAACRR